MVLECKEALRQGYLAYKTKGRPWIDLWQQIAQSVEVVPEEFKIDMDFNDTLLDAERAIPILKEFEKHPQIGIYESPIFQDDIDEWWHHPRLSNESKPAAMLSLCSPFAPEERVRETIWMYSQGAPVVFVGDLNYYGKEHDLRETAQNIDTSKCMLYVLSADYDWSAYPEACKELADKVPGAKYTLMEGMGHFPMSEDPVKFKQYIMPVLEEIERNSADAGEVASAG